MNKKKLTLQIICLLLLLLGTFTYIIKRKIDETKKEELSILAEQYNSVLKELRKEKEEITSNIEELKKELQIEGMGSTIVLISDIRKDCLNDAIATMDEYGYHGVIAIDDKNYTDNNNEQFLNKNEIDELTLKGYELVLTVDSDSDIIDLYNQYTNNGYEIKGFYFPNDDITTIQLEKIKSLNIESIITYLDNINDNDIFSIFSIGSYQSNARSMFELNINDSLTLAFSVGYGRDVDSYEYDNFNNMLRTIKEYCEKGLTQATNISEAQNRYEIYKEELINMSQSDKIERINELEKELKEIEEKMYSN